ncbi:CatB-related O-acetyltransferase [Roseospira visakhapatnamensis]|uniref:Virginiamycin A acetyltransferase n=1 Tax=Roseospira visakhapatnamensis TaxID=390880 RepID=A0A7W6REU7_9PROT|nr:CatB-related O-acetyltransferase [Roseospira visakhapatnamensis]MBB4267012.1 virginiamycin A acetyltransferase [Roseospira visakhapatnamensis]
MPPSDAAIPDPDVLYPLAGFTGMVLLKPLLAQRPPMAGADTVDVGAYSYYSDFQDPLAFFERNVCYHFGYGQARLRIGRFCAIAHGTTIMMADANHAMAGPSTFPFPVFGGAWAAAVPMRDMPFPKRGDTVIGNDVWLGHECLLMPGVTVGDGAIVAARAVVSRDVPPYAVVAGNPARVVRQRFSDDEIARLRALAWWTWPPETLIRALPTVVRGDVAALETLAPEGVSVA